MAKIIAHPKDVWLDGRHMGRTPRRLQCDCGEIIALNDPLDNTCPKCGENYNMSGQRVLHSLDERVEEPLYEDDWN